MHRISGRLIYLARVQLRCVCRIGIYCGTDAFVAIVEAIDAWQPMALIEALAF
ncbi:MAG: hypothetical protein KJ725_12420 [Gammaproteobacteria bacterium]|nr:hypothetical protein [Gammaproteobacteria bacterium]